VLDGVRHPCHVVRMAKRIHVRALIAASALVLGAVATGGAAQAASCGKTAYEDGTFGPAVCANGKANTAVRAEYRQAAPAIMALKKKSTRKQILAAMCSDHTARATNVQIFDALQYQEARHDWTPRVIRRAERDIVNDRFC